MKVLLVRLSAIGDVVHTLPTLAALHRAGHEVSWLVEPPARDLLTDNPALHQVVYAPRSRQFVFADARNAVQALRARKLDVALDLQGLWKSVAWARLSGAKRTIGYARAARREGSSALLLHEDMALPSGIVHVIDKNLALLRTLGIEAVGDRTFPLPPAEAATKRVTAELAAAGLRDYAIVNPGGGWTSKLWPVESMGALARALKARGLTPLVTWGPGEQDLAARVVTASDGAARTSFPTTIPELIELLRRARLVVAADTGPLHLACAVGTPVVALFGPTDPARNGPFAAEDEVVSRRPACFPCYRRGCAVHDGVMKAIDVADVVAAVDRRLARSAAVVERA
jgi:ADP-heptose:LPS heptosyltransferase